MLRNGNGLFVTCENLLILVDSKQQQQQPQPQQQQQQQQ